MKNADCVPSKKVLAFIISGLVIICAILSVNVILSYTDNKMDEDVYMRNVYADLNEILQLIDTILDEDTEEEPLNESIIALRFVLRHISDQLEDGQRYVAECIPGVAAWWFDETAASLQNIGVSNQGELSSESRMKLAQLAEQIQVLVDQMTDEDQVDLKESLSIEAFSKIIYNFYIVQ